MNEIEKGTTVVITHRIREGQKAAYEEWLKEISPISRSAVGHLDWQIIRPIEGLTSTYTVILRFDTCGNMQKWMKSNERKRLIDKVRPLLDQDDNYVIRSGLDFWFQQEDTKASVPVRWKQALVTWTAIYPLVLIMPLLIVPILRQTGFPNYRYLDTLIVTGILVYMMTYWIMPNYTKLIQRWLYN